MRGRAAAVGRQRWPLPALLLLAAAAGPAAGTQYRKTYLARDTQLHWIDGSGPRRGVLTSDGFGQRPWQRRERPHHATWLLRAPSNHTLFVYMTQYHLPDGALRVESYYECLKDRAQHAAMCFWDNDGAPGDAQGGVASSREAERDTNVLLVTRRNRFAAPKPGDHWLVLSLELPAGGGDATGACLPSSQSRGFNITYEMVTLTQPVRTVAEYSRLIRKDVCSLDRCNLNGDCIASADFREYSCRCRPGFYGTRCEHGALCDPDNLINPCHNNGTCRQVRGRVECRCPSPYHGSRCQLKRTGIQDTNYCRQRWRLECEHGCEPDAARCACHQGYQLVQDGAATHCHTRRKALRRYVIQVTIKDNDIQLDDSNVEARFGFNHSMFEQSKPLRVIDKSSGDLGLGRLRLQLPATAADETAVYRWFADRVGRGRIGDVAVRPAQFTFRSDPEMLITSLTLDNGGRPKALGSSMRLTCRVRGSAATEVHWYRGQDLINVTTASALRERPISSGSFRVGASEEWNHYLAVDRLVPEDEGSFVCRARDGYGSQRRAVQLSLPSLRLTPRVTPPHVSVRPGRNVTIQCEVRSPYHQNITFVWSRAVGLEAPRPLTEQDSEQVVTYCWGSSTLIVREPQTARYDCEVLLGPLSSRRSAQVHVIRPGVLTCARATAANVTWQETMAEHEDVQPCPGGDVDITLPGQVIRVPARYARRRCVLQRRSVAGWAEPDLSSCIDRDLFLLRRKVGQMMAGYEVLTPEAALRRLEQLVQQRLELSEEREPAALLDSEVEAFRAVLASVVHFMLKVSPDKEFRRLEEAVLNSAAPLLAEDGARMTDQAKYEMISLVMSFLLRRVFVHQPVSSPQDVYVGTRLLSYDGSAKRVLLPYRADRRPRWMAATAEVSLESDRPWRSYSRLESQLGLVVLVSQRSHELFPNGYTPMKNTAGLGRSGDLFVLHSRLVSVGLSKRPRLLESPSPPELVVSLQLQPLTRQWNGSQQSHSCARLSEGGRWRLDACQISQQGNHTFSCSCRRLGTYALALVTKQESLLRSTLLSLHLPVAVGCLLSMPLLLYSAGALLLFCWRRPTLAAVLQLQTPIILTVAMAIFMVSARDSPHQDYQAVSAAVLQCLVLSAISTQMAIKMHVFGEQHRLRRMSGEPGYFKYLVFFIALGVPVLVTAATVTTQHTYGWDGLRSWWIVHSSSFFYGVVVPVAVLLLLDTVLLLYVRSLLVLKVALPGRQSSSWITARLDLMMRSHVIEVMLVLMVISSTLYINFEGLLCQVVFAGMCVVTSLTVLVCNVLRGDSGVPAPGFCRKSAGNKATPLEEREPAATLRSHSVLRQPAADGGSRPLLAGCACRQRPSPPASAGSAVTEVGTTSSGCGSTDPAAAPLCPPQAARAAPPAPAEDAEQDDGDAFDAPAKPRRAPVAAAPAAPAAVPAQRTAAGGQRPAAESGRSTAREQNGDGAEHGPKRRAAAARQPAREAVA